MKSYCRGLSVAFVILNSLGVTSILFSSHMFLLWNSQANFVDHQITSSAMPPPPLPSRPSGVVVTTTAKRNQHPKSATTITTTTTANNNNIVKTTNTNTTNNKGNDNNNDNNEESIKKTTKQQKVTANHHHANITSTVHDAVTSPASDNQRLRLLHKDQKETLKRLLQLGIDPPSILNNNGIESSLPPWSSIVEQYGTQPVILGLETCAPYRQQVPLEQRWIASAGLFHTGTNLLADLLTGTCHFFSSSSSQTSSSTTTSSPFKWQVPWGKHNPVKARASYTIPKPKYQGIDPSTVFPLVLTRHPIDWMPSMCRQPYAVSWNRSTSTSTSTSTNTSTNTSTSTSTCPDLGQPVRANLYQTQDYSSLLHFWNEWNGGYYYSNGNDNGNGNANSNSTTTFPRLMIRLEDLVYFPKPTLRTICDCVGGQFLWIPELLSYKRGGHVGNNKGTPTQQHQQQPRHPLVQAWQRHANIHTTMRQMDRQHQTATREIMDFQLLHALGYRLLDGDDD